MTLAQLEFDIALAKLNGAMGATEVRIGDPHFEGSIEVESSALQSAQSDNHAFIVGSEYDYPSEYRTENS